MARKTSMTAIAKELYLATSTVSRALAGKKGVSEQTRRRVAAAAMRHGFMPELIPAPASVEVALLMDKRTTEDRDFWGKVSDGVQKGISLYDSFCSLVVTDHAAPEFHLPPIFQEVGRVAGVIAIHSTDIRAIQAVKRLGLPIVLVSYLGRCPGCDSVIIDSYNGTYMVATELLKLGHLRFGFVGNQSSLSFRLRYMGILAALIEYGISDLVPKCYKTDLSDMDWDNLPTALFCNTDQSAAKVITHFLHRRIRVPEDVSVIGFDDHPSKIAECPVPLTTLHVDTEELGLWAVRLLFQRLSNPDGHPVQLVSEVTPIWRQSTGKPRMDR
ncbi:MAG: substrate-binding domain-containing protein [Bacteroidota bacterium]